MLTVNSIICMPQGCSFLPIFYCHFLFSSYQTFSALSTPNRSKSKKLHHRPCHLPPLIILKSKKKEADLSSSTHHLPPLLIPIKRKKRRTSHSRHRFCPSNVYRHQACHHRSPLSSPKVVEAPYHIASVSADTWLEGKVRWCFASSYVDALLKHRH